MNASITKGVITVKFLSCYREAHKKQALSYSTLAIEKSDAIEKRSYELKSQNWRTAQAVTPGEWFHRVDIYIPLNAHSNRATLIVNKGINNGDDKNPVKKAKTPHH